MEHAASPSLITLGLTTAPSSEESSIRWGLAASFILHALVIVMAMSIRFQSESEQPFRTIDVALISLPALPTTTPSSKPVPTPTEKSAVAQPSQKIVPPPPAPTAPPVEDTLLPLPTQSALERLSESLDGAINSIVIPQKREATSTPIPSQEPNLQPSEDQSPLLENLQLPSAPPTIARPKPLQRAEPLRIPSAPAPPLMAVPKKPQPTSKPPSQQSSSPTPKVRPAVKPAPAIPSLSEVTPFKKSLPRTTPLKTLPATNLEESLKRSLPDMPTPAPVRRVPKLSRERSKIQPDQKSFTPKISAPPLLKIPESPEQIPAMPPPPKMMDTVKKLMEGLKSTTRTPAPKPVPLQRRKPSPKASPSIKPPPSEIGKRIANLPIPEVAQVESIKQRLDQIHVQSLSDTNASASRQSPGENRYFAIIEAAINKRWVNPNVPINNKKVIITFRVEKSGEISRIHVEQSSGNTHYDSTILGAIREAKLPKFPSDLQKSFLTIKFLFKMPE